jgi:hypothetical protein
MIYEDSGTLSGNAELHLQHTAQLLQTITSLQARSAHNASTVHCCCSSQHAECLSIAQRRNIVPQQSQKPVLPGTAEPLKQLLYTLIQAVQAQPCRFLRVAASAQPTCRAPGHNPLLATHISHTALSANKR